MQCTEFADMAINASATLAAAFLGSFSAYYLSVRREELKQRDTNAAAANTALFVLGQQMNRLQNIRAQFINPMRQDPFRFITIMPIHPTHGSLLRIDMASVAFMLDAHPELLMELALVQDQFEIAEAVIRERSRIHHDEVQPAMKRAGVSEGTTLTRSQIEELLGVRLLPHIERATDQMIDVVDNTHKRIQSLFPDMWDALKSQFPHRKFVRFEAKVNS